jgi:hypothetical protein
MNNNPGAVYIRDMLRATILYTKDNLSSMYEDLKEYVENQDGKIVEFSMKS